MKRILIRTAAIASVALLLTGATTATQAAAATPTVEVHAGEYGKGTTCTAGDLCSIDAAVNRAVTLAKQGERPDVLLHKGRYWLDKGIVLGAEAAGVSIRAAGDGEPILDGGRPVNGWEAAPEVDSGVFKAQLPSDTAVFRQLYDYGTRSVLARYPNRTDEGTAGPYLRLPEQPAATSPEACKSLGARANCDLTMPAIPADSVSGEWWHGAQLVKIDHWRYKELNIAAVAPAGGDNTVVGFMDGTQKVVHPNGDWNFLWDNTPPVDSPYFVQDSLALLDAAREWYYNKDSHVVYYKPANGAAPPNGQVVVPQVEQLLTVSKTRDISVSGVTFQHSNWSAPDAVGYATIQTGQPQWTTASETPVPGALAISSGERITLDGNIVRRTGAHGIAVDGVSADITITDNRVSDTSSGGISLYAGAARLSTVHTINTARVTGNVVRDTGKHYADGAGIYGSHVCDTKVEHNDVSYTKFSGISLGLMSATLDLDETDDLRNRCELDGQLNGPGQHNTVSGNRISNAMTLLDDGGGIYVMGRNLGMRIDENFVSGVRRSVYSANNPVPGIYIDGTSADMTAARNVLDIGETAGFFVAPRNTFRNVVEENWHSGPSGKLDQDGLTERDNHAVEDGAWPDAALGVMARAGLQNGDALPRTLTVTSPAPSNAVYDDLPTFTGLAQPGSTIEVVGSTTNLVLASTTAGTDGRWSAKSMISLEVSTTPHRVLVRELRDGATRMNPTDERIATFTRVAPVVVTSPVEASRQFLPVAIVEGTSAPYASIEVRGAIRNVVLGSATADAAGNWSATVPDVAIVGETVAPYTYNVHEYVGTARMHTASVSFARLSKDDVRPLVVIAPVNGGVATGEYPTFTGTGEPGQTVTLTASAGAELGSAVVDADGVWTATSVIRLSRIDGPFTVTARLWIAKVVEQKVVFTFSVDAG